MSRLATFRKRKFHPGGTEKPIGPDGWPELGSEIKSDAFILNASLDGGSRKRGKDKATTDATTTDGTVKPDAPVKSAA